LQIDNIQSVLDRLSSQQLKAACSDGTAIRMSACAGSGKTEALTGRIIYLLSTEVDPSHIIAFTFTNRAAQSMKTRLQRRIVELAGQESRRILGPMFIGTIHSYCLKILQDYAGYDNYDVLNEHRETAFAIEHGVEIGLHQAINDILQRKANYSTAISIFRRSVGVVYDENMDRGLLRRFSPKFASLLLTYEKIMSDYLVFNFGQLIALCVGTLEDKQSVRDQVVGSIEHLLVDEYQDLNSAQERLIQILMSKGGKLFVVGDANQCIYQWRGSDVHCFEHFQSKFPDSEIIILNENRRSRPDIVNTANKFIRTITGSLDEVMVPLQDQSDDCVWCVEENTPEDEASWVANKILELNTSGVDFKDIAVLLRSVKTSGESFIKEFRKNRIPFILGGRIGLFNRSEAQALGRIFAWLSDTPWIEDPHKGAQTQYLLENALLDDWCCTPEQYPHYKTCFEELKVEVARNKYHNLTEIFRHIINALGFLLLNPNDLSDKSTMAVLGRFNQLLADYESMRKRRDALNTAYLDISLLELLKGFTWYVNTYASSEYEDEFSEDIHDMDAVTLTTIHQAKGLEWPVVFVPCLVSRRFPSSKTGQKREWLLHRGIFDTSRYESTVLDERRLFYVALTRARDGLYLSWFRRSKKMCADRSPFVLSALRDGIDTSSDNAGICQISSRVLDEEPEASTFSPSEIIWYRRCPYSYLLRRIWGFQPGLVRELGYGKALHHIMRLIGNEVKLGNPINARVARDIIEKHFYLPYAPPAIANAMKESASIKIARFIDNNIDDIKRIQQVEARLAFPIGPASISGIVDVILRGSGESVEVRDYKTTKEDPYIVDEADFQIRLYTGGLQQIGYSVCAASIANLEEGSIQEVDISQGIVPSTVNEAEQYVIGIKSGNFDPKLGPRCKKCDYCDICCYYKAK